jgi:hypothetical protein
MKKSIIGAITLFALLSNCSDESEIDIRKNLVGEYLFNGNANDTSPENANHGTVFGASLTTDRAGNDNSAYSFDGVNDYISIPDNDATDFTSEGDFSISLWVAPAEVQADETSPINDILRKWVGDNNDPYSFSISLLNRTHANNPNELFIATYDGSTCENVTSDYSGEITYNGFTHFVFIKKSNMLIQYVNGEKVSEIMSSVECSTSNDLPITIGCRGQLVRFFTGKVDDLRFYDVALDKGVITELYKRKAN